MTDSTAAFGFLDVEYALRLQRAETFKALDAFVAARTREVRGMHPKARGYVQLATTVKLGRRALSRLRRGDPLDSCESRVVREALRAAT